MHLMRDTAQPHHTFKDVETDKTSIKHISSTEASMVEQDPANQRVPTRAIVITLLCGFNWIAHLYTLNIFAAFARNIAQSLDAPAKAIWVFNAASIVTVVCAPVFSYMSDIYGRRWFMIIPYFFGIIGGIIGATAKNINTVIIASAFVGVAASLFGIVTAIPSEVLPHKYRSIGAGVVFLMSGFAAFPALLGIGRAIQNDPVNGWRWIFYSEIISYGLQAVLWFFAYHPPKRDNSLTRNRPKLDWVGYTLLILSVVPFLLALSWGGVVAPWVSAQVLVPLLLSFALWASFFAWEWNGRTDGILHHDLFKDRNFSWSLVGLMVEGWTYLTFSAIYPAHTATVFESDIFKSGVRAMPFYAAFLPMLTIGAIVVKYTRAMIVPSFVGYIIFSCAILGFVFVTPSSSKLMLGLDALAGFGFSQPLLLLTIVGQFAVPPELIGSATALLLTLRGLAGAIGQAVANSVVQQKLATAIPENIAAATIPLGLNPELLAQFIPGLASGNPEVIGSLLNLPGVTPEILQAGITALKAAFNSAYRLAWITLVPVAFVGAFCCLLLKGQKEKFTDVVDAPLKPIDPKNQAQA